MDKTDHTDSSERNIMPSMVVRQQKLAQSGLSSFNPNKVTADSVSTKSSTNTHELCKSAAAAAEQSNLIEKAHLFDEAGLIVPKKVTPVPLNAGGLNSALIIPTTMHDLNRELKFNQTHGKNVLDKKSELRRAMDKLEANRRRKEAEVERLNRRSSLELRLEQRAEKIGQSSCAQDNPIGVLSQSQQPRASSAEDATTTSLNMPNSSQIKFTTG